MNDIHNQSPIELRVMRRIRLIRLLGLIISTVTLAVLTLVLALWGIGKEVWVARVFQNAPADITQVPNFFLNAFGHARLIVQLLSIITFCAFLYLARATIRAISSVFSVRA